MFFLRLESFGLEVLLGSAVPKCNIACLKSCLSLHSVASANAGADPLESLVCLPVASLLILAIL